MAKYWKVSEENENLSTTNTADSDQKIILSSPMSRLQSFSNFFGSKRLFGADVIQMFPSTPLTNFAIDKVFVRSQKFFLGSDNKF